MKAYRKYVGAVIELQKQPLRAVRLVDASLGPIDHEYDRGPGQRAAQEDARHRICSENAGKQLRERCKRLGSMSFTARRSAQTDEVHHSLFQLSFGYLFLLS